MKEQEKKILYPSSLTMSEVKSAFELEFGYPPRVVLHTPEGWLIANDAELEDFVLVDGDEDGQ